MREIATLETFGEVKLINEISKMSKKIRENSAEVAVMCSTLYELNPNKETTDALIERTGFSKATITQLKEAGNFYRKHPNMLDLETTKAYLISSIEKKDEDVVIEDLSKKSVKDLRNEIKNKRATSSSHLEDAVEDTEDEVATGEVIEDEEDDNYLDTDAIVNNLNNYGIENYFKRIMEAMEHYGNKQYDKVDVLRVLARSFADMFGKGDM